VSSRSRRAGATRERILEATRRLLEKHGAAAVRLEDVGREAGCSRQAVYLHFGSRASLLVALVERIDEQGGVLEAARSWHAPEMDAVARLETFLAWWSEYLPKIRPVAQALLAERAFDDAADAAWQNRMAALHNGARFLVDRLAKENALAPAWKPAEAADWLWALISVQLYETLAERGWSHRRYVDRLRRVVRAALLA
jgi:AcrR family transcriptional regulator